MKAHLSDCRHLFDKIIRTEAQPSRWLRHYASNTCALIKWSDDYEHRKKHLSVNNFP